MILVIDGLDNLIVKLGLFNGETLLTHNFEAERNLSERLSVEIGKFLKKNKTKFSDLTQLAVTVGPGHFSRIRSCVATANALAYAQGVEILSLKRDWKINDLTKVSQKQVKPIYDRPPNITQSKSRLTKFGKKLR